MKSELDFLTLIKQPFLEEFYEVNAELLSLTNDGVFSLSD